MYLVICNINCIIQEVKAYQQFCTDEPNSIWVSKVEYIINNTCIALFRYKGLVRTTSRELSRDSDYSYDDACACYKIQLPFM